MRSHWLLLSAVVFASASACTEPGWQPDADATGTPLTTPTGTPSPTPPANGTPTGTPSPTPTPSPEPTATATPTPLATPSPPPTPVPTATAPPQVFVGAGDIAGCNNDNDEITARLLDDIPGTVFTLGDNAYDSGTLDEYMRCYEPTWGRHKARTVPVPGNHEYATPGAAGYFAYFGAAAGEPGKGWYSFDLGAWHVVVLNSNCWSIEGGCGVGSPQEQWLRADLAASTKKCTIALWHHSRFSSSKHGDDRRTRAFWQALYEHGAEVVLTSHDHTYERFAPQTADGVADPVRGIRAFVVGSGGRSHYELPNPGPNSEVRNGDTYGVLRLTLRDGSYDWAFIPEPGKTFTDTGTGLCH